MCKTSNFPVKITKPLKFHVRIKSDVSDIVDRINERKIAIPITRNLRQTKGDAVLKHHQIMLTAGAEERVIASFAAHTVNGSMFQRLGTTLDDLREAAEDNDFVIDPATAKHLYAGTNFLQVREFFVLPDYQHQGIGSWLLREAPMIIATFLGQMFTHIIFPLDAYMFKSELKHNPKLENDFAQMRFEQEREKVLCKMLQASGYTGIPDMPGIFEKILF